MSIPAFHSEEIDVEMPKLDINIQRFQKNPKEYYRNFLNDPHLNFQTSSELCLRGRIRTFKKMDILNKIKRNQFLFSDFKTVI